MVRAKCSGRSRGWGGGWRRGPSGDLRRPWKGPRSHVGGTGCSSLPLPFMAITAHCTAHYANELQHQTSMGVYCHLELISNQEEDRMDATGKWEREQCRVKSGLGQCWCLGGREG